MDFGDLIIYVASFFGLFTSFYFFWTLFERGIKPSKKLPPNRPKVTICVPCYNEENTVVKTLSSLSKLNYPKDKYEIIVVDDGSKDNTYNLALEYANEHKHVDIKVFKKSNGGKYTALNFAIKKANGEIFGALDADSFVHRNALRNIVSTFYSSGATAVTPSMMVHKPKNILQHIQYAEYLLGVFLRKVFAGLGSINVTPGPFSFFKKDFLVKNSGFHKAYHTEDIELALRVQQQNKVIDNAVDAYVYTVAPSDFKTLWHQRIRWYYGFLRNLYDKRDLFSIKHGNLGIIMLPSSIISIFITIIILFYLVIIWIKNIILHINQWVVVGFKFFDFKFVVDYFFVNTSPTAILGLLGLIVSVSMFIIAKRLSGETRSLFKPFVSFVLFYPVLYPLWWLASIWKIVFNQEVKWWHKSETKFKSGDKI